MGVLNSADRVLVSLHSTDEVVATTLPVDLVTTTWRTMLRAVVPVTAGDLLDVSAWARVTNDVGYTVGVGWHLWAYDADSGLGTAGPWWRISLSCGDNVDKARHHMPLTISTVYEVRADWPEGHRIVVALRADAHSTAWKKGDLLTVDRLGHLVVRRWSTPTPPAPAPEPCPEQPADPDPQDPPAEPPTDPEQPGNN